MRQAAIMIDSLLILFVTIRKYYRENKTDDGDKIIYRKNMAT